MKPAQLFFAVLLVFVITCAHAQVTRSYDQLDHDQMRAIRQSIANGKLTYGWGLSLVVDIGKRNTSYIRLSVVGGIGCAFGEGLIDKNRLYPTYHTELELYRGGLGAQVGVSNYGKIDLEIRNSFNLTTSFDGATIAENFKPVVYFVSYSAKPIQNPYKSSITLGTTFVNSLRYRRNQRVGNVGLSFNNVVMHYMNDGAPPFSWLSLGDEYDRWWTGMGYVGIFPSDWGQVDRLEIMFEKFTGWQPFGYELSSNLRLEQIAYKRSGENLFNQARLGARLGLNNGMAFHVNAYDYPLSDIQNIIHYVQQSSYHPPALKGRFSLGAGYFYQNQFIRL